MGLVVEAYREAGIAFIETDETRLPVVSLDVLKRIYPELGSPNWRERNRNFGWGLDGDGPWPVLLPGYLFHALNRAEQVLRTLPYEPKAGDERFD